MAHSTFDRSDMSSTVEGYAHQSFPSLVLQHVPSARLQVARKSDHEASLEQSKFQAAAILLTAAYVDSTDLLVELRTKDESSIQLVRLDTTSFTDGKNAIAVVNQAFEQAATFDENSYAKAREIIGAPTDRSTAVLHFIENNSIDSDDWFPTHGIALFASPSGVMSLVADQSILSEDAARLFLAQLDQVVAHLLSSPDAAVDLLTVNFSDGMLLSSNSPSFEASRAHCVIDWLAKNAQDRPESIAHELYSSTDDAAETITYLQLHERSDSLAHWLSGRGVQQGDAVAVCSPRTGDFYVANAAIWKVGGCYVPIDVDLPPQRKSFIAKDSQAKLVLCDSTQMQLFEGDQAIDLAREDLCGEVTSGYTDSFQSRAQLDSVAYLLYTSGTTGTPKGCLQLHRGLFWAIDAMVEMPREITNPDTDKRLAMAAVAFDVHISEIAQSWALGTRLVSVASRLDLLSALQENIIRFGISHVGMVPSMIEATLTKDVEELPIKYLVSGGEKATDVVLQKWATNPRVVFANFYGPTEATIGCTARRVKVRDRKDNIGQPFPSCTAYVVRLNADAQPVLVPRGVSGELVVEGALVGQGYLGLDEATRKAFMEWPHAGCRAYRTGDLVRMSSDGSILIAGRIDSQIKLRGVRIESEGVSNVVRSASSDTELDATSVVTDHPQVGAAELLVTFVAESHRFSAVERRDQPVIEPLAADVSEQLRDGANRELASYMRPSHIIPVNFLPLSHNGKIDAKVLIALFRESKLDKLLQAQHLNNNEPTDEDAARAPTDIESTIIECVSVILDHQNLDLLPRTRFAETGLSSMQMATLTTNLRKAFGCRLALAELLASEDVQSCAALIENLRSHSADNDEEDVLDIANFSRQHWSEAEELYSSDHIEVVLPTFPVQPGILFQTSQDPSGYVQHFLYACSVPDGKLLKSKWHTLMKRHQILRSVFVDGGAEPLLVVLKAEACVLPYEEVELSNDEVHSDSSFVDYFRSVHAADVSTAINEDFSSPMWAVHSFHMSSASKTFFALSLNHTIYDAFAVRALVEDLDALLSAQSLDQNPISLESILAEIGISDTPSHKAFWVEHLASRSIAQKRRSLQGSALQSDRLTRTFNIPCADVLSSCSTLGVSVQSFFNTAFALSGKNLFSWHQEALFGGIRSGRNIPLEGVKDGVCPLVTLIPTFVDLRHRTGADLLAGAQASLVQTLPHERVPLGLIQRWVGSNDLFRALFSCRIEDGPKVYQNLQHIGGTSVPPEFPLAIEMLLDGSADTIEARAAYTNPDFSSSQIDDLLERIEQVVEALLSGQDDDLQLNADADTASASLDDNNAPPVTATIDPNDLALATRILCTFLDIDKKSVSPSSSLVSLGLTSLRAVALARRFKDEGISVDPMDIIQGDSTRAIVCKMQDKAGASTSSSESTMRLEKLEEAIAEELHVLELQLSDSDTVQLALCTPLQAGMLSQTVSSPVPSTYVHAFVLQLEKDVDADALREAWITAVARFDILRTSFHFAPRAGRWVQAVHTANSAVLKWESKNIPAIGNFHSHGKQLLSDVNLSSEAALQTPPLHIRHITDPQYSILAVAMHHALYDGVALNNLLRHVTNFYRKVEVPAIAAFASISRQIVAQEELATAYWVTRMDGANTFHLLPDANATPSKEAWRSSISVPLKDPTDVARITKRYKVTAQTIGQLALAKVLAIRSNTTDVTFCQVVSGRTLANAGEVVGPVFNTIPCRLQLSTRMTGREALRKLQHDNVDSIAHQHASLRSIQQQLHARILGDVLFVYQPHIDPEDERDHIWTMHERPSEVHETQTHFALNVEVHEEVGSLKVKASCAKSVLSFDGLERFLDQIRQALSDVIHRANEVLLPADLVIKASDPSTQACSQITSNSEQGDKPAQSGTEKLNSAQLKVRDLLAEILGVDASGMRMDARLLSLGLDSISAIQLASRARHEGIQLVPNSIIKSPTLKILMETVTQATPRDESSTASEMGNGISSVAAVLDHKLASQALVHLDPTLRPNAKTIRATPGIEYLFAGWQYAGGRAFHLVLCRQAFQHLDLKALQAAWLSLVKHHAILRSAIGPTGDNDVRLAINIVDSSVFEPRFTLERLDATNEDNAVRERSRALLQHPVPASSPSPRMTVLRGKAHDYILLDLMHIHYDGWSIGLLMSDLEALYLGRRASTVSDLEAFCASVTVSERQRLYWQETFGQKPPSLLAIPKTSSPEHELLLEHIELRNQDDRLPTLRELEAVASKLEVSPASLVIGAWAHVHAANTKDPSALGSATFGLVISGRSSATIEQIESLAVPCLNLVPVNLDNIRPDVNTGSLHDTARRFYQQHSERPEEADQGRVSDIARWIGRSRELLLNVSVNTVFAIAGRFSSASQTEAKEAKEISAAATPSFWQPFKVPHMIEYDEAASAVPESYGAEKDLIIPEIQLDMRLVAATSETGRLILTAHAGSETAISLRAERLLAQWGEHLIAMVGP